MRMTWPVKNRGGAGQVKSTDFALVRFSKNLGIVIVTRFYLNNFQL